MLNAIQREIQTIKGCILQKVSHPYLMKYVKSPFIDEDKLLALHTIFVESNLSEKERQYYAITIMLVQIALDIHDEVSIDHLDNETDQKHRQLTVLAGDYYSGLYYLLLSEISDLKMVKMLAEAIKEINEQKIVLYQKDRTLPELVSILKEIETGLITKTANYFKITRPITFLKDFLFLKRLINERSVFVKTGRSLLFDSIKHDTNNSYPNEENRRTLLRDYDSFIWKCKKTVEMNSDHALSSKKIFELRLEELLYKSGLLIEKAVEEG